MTIKLDQDQLNSLVAAVIQHINSQPAAAAPSAPSAPKAGYDLGAKDRGLIADFKRKGIKEADIKLMNRLDLISLTTFGPSATPRKRPAGSAKAAWSSVASVVCEAYSTSAKPM